MLGLRVSATIRALLSGTFLQRKDVVNQCLEFGAGTARKYVEPFQAVARAVAV